MAILLLGINFRTASVALREQFAFNSQELPLLLESCLQQVGFEEVAIISTCNRTEIIGVMPSDQGQSAIDWLIELKKEQSLSALHVAEHLYEFWDQNAVTHLFRVACGLDSLVLGEPQILGQLKDAYQLAQTARTIGGTLHRLFQRAFSVAKEVRTRTEIGTNPVSVAFVAVHLAKQLFHLKKKNILLIGAGETVELLLQHFSALEVGKIQVANRTLSRAQQLAETYGVGAVPLSELSKCLEEADVVATSTASAEPIIDVTMIKQAQKKRKHRPLFMIDLAVPRDISPAVGDLEDVYLYGVDDLNQVVEDNKRLRQDAALEADKIVEARAALWLEGLSELSSHTMVRRYREHAQQIVQAVSLEGVHRLGQGEDPQSVLVRSCELLMNKLMHAPTVAMKDAGKEKRYDLLEWAETLLGLPKNDK